MPVAPKLNPVAGAAAVVVAVPNAGAVRAVRNNQMQNINKTLKRQVKLTWVKLTW